MHALLRCIVIYSKSFSLVCYLFNLNYSHEHCILKHIDCYFHTVYQHSLSWKVTGSEGWNYIYICASLCACGISQVILIDRYVYIYTYMCIYVKADRITTHITSKFVLEQLKHKQTLWTREPLGTSKSIVQIDYQIVSIQKYWPQN